MLKNILAVMVTMSSDEQIAKTQNIDEMNRQLTFKFPKTKRKQISLIREKYRYDAYKDTVRYPYDFSKPLHLIREDKREEIENIVAEAHIELQKIHPDLYAKVRFAQLDRKHMEEGSVREHIYWCIMAQMSNRFNNHVKKLKSETPNKRSQKNLKEMIAEFKELNIFKDKRIDDKIQDLEWMLQKKTVDIKNTILADLDNISKMLENF